MPIVGAVNELLEGEVQIDELLDTLLGELGRPATRKTKNRSRFPSFPSRHSALGSSLFSSPAGESCTRRSGTGGDGLRCAKVQVFRTFMAPR